MRFALRPTLTSGAALAGLAFLAGCGQPGGPARPPVKPDLLTARVATPDAAPGRHALTLARVSTKSGEILILEPDGQVTRMQLDSPEGRQAFALTEAELRSRPPEAGRAPTVRLSAAGSNRRETSQERALREFAARAQPALPEWRNAAPVDEDLFLGTHVQRLGVGPKSGPSAGDELVEVTANLREGVDADIAFSYATCALAGWAKAEGIGFGRHIRTLQDTRDGKLLIGAAFTISDSRPLGLRVMETNETLRECKARGIPAA